MNSQQITLASYTCGGRRLHTHRTALAVKRPSMTVSGVALAIWTYDVMVAVHWFAG